MKLRPYQQEAINTVDQFIINDTGHGVVELPTASGKTIIFNSMIKGWFDRWEGIRILILAHRQELLEQAEEKMKPIFPDAKIGVYSAGLNRRETEGNIIIAGIQSVYNKADLLGKFNCVIVDECHLVPNDENTMYRRFFDNLAKYNDKMRILGFTATAYRLDGGLLYGEEEDKIFKKLIFKAGIDELIKDGYLCKLTTKATDNYIDANKVKKRGGDFVISELQKLVESFDIVPQAVKEIVDKAHDRKTILVFCCGVDHAYKVYSEFNSHGWKPEIITGETDKKERKATLKKFDEGKLKVLINVDCLTTGLDITGIDCIACLRPTESTSLWVQMVGRGLRLHPGKEDCLILDFGQNAFRHGALNALKIKTKKDGRGTGEAPAKKCPECLEMVATAVKECTECGYEFPATEVTHDVVASKVALFESNKPEIVEVTSINLFIHKKKDSPDSLKVEYRSGVNSYSQYVCLNHEGYAKRLAVEWWFRMFKGMPAVPISNIVANTFYVEHLRKMVKAVEIKRKGKFINVNKVFLEDEDRITYKQSDNG